MEAKTTNSEIFPGISGKWYGLRKMATIDVCFSSMKAVKYTEANDSIGAKTADPSASRILIDVKAAGSARIFMTNKKGVFTAIFSALVLGLASQVSAGTLFQKNFEEP